MKNKKLLIASLIVFGICSCNKDDDAPSKSEEDTLIGKWELVSSTYDGKLELATECKAKSIIEFENNNTFKDITVTESENSKDCVYDGFGVSGSFVFNEETRTLIRTNTDVITIPVNLNNPDFIEGAKGENDAEIISFANGNLSIRQQYKEQGVTFTTTYTYKKTSKNFFSE